MNDEGTLRIPGLRYIPDYLNWSTHDRLLAAVDSQPWQPGGGRRVQSYGYAYDYESRSMRPTGELPDWALELSIRFEKDGINPYLADQMLATEYQPGQGIFPHIDVPFFADTIVSLSLGSTCVMEFVDGRSGEKRTLLIEPRSALVLSGEARSSWQHSVPARGTDTWMGRELPRQRRVSLTFRKVVPPSEDLDRN